ncbi:MAG: DNA-3-methyladenine glycosylase I [Oleiphilus sp.]|nr:MAG: DNA-3-methyladenine glycosylase I [Oleiphilus sp.]
MTKELERCPWCGTDPIYQQYHDQVWGRPVRDDQVLFEKLCLDGQQAGLSWITILKKQASYERAYANFDAEKIVGFDQQKIDSLMQDPGIIRNKLKVQSIIKNARSYLNYRDSGKSFSDFLWQFVGGTPIQNYFETIEDVPALTPESEAMSKALKSMGFSFVGPTICYAFMQAVGLVNDHLQTCPQWQECRDLAN